MSRKKDKRRRDARRISTAARRDHGDVMRSRYYRTRARHDGRCACCGRRIKRGEPIAYRKAGPVVLYLPHAQADPQIKLFDSAQWAMAKERPQRTAGSQGNAGRAASSVLDHARSWMTAEQFAVVEEAMKRRTR